jgi:hypothetical protein
MVSTAVCQEESLMLLAVTNTVEYALPFLVIISVAYLALMLLLMMMIRSLEFKLLALGLLTALLAIWFWYLSGGGASVQVRGGQVGEMGASLAGYDGSGMLGRISVLLVLSGVAVIVLGRWSQDTVLTKQGETSHGQTP